MGAVGITLVVMFIGCLYDTEAVGGKFDESEMREKLRQCMNQPEPQWNFTIPGYCAVFFCTKEVKYWENETVEGKRTTVRAETFGCPIDYVITGCYTEDLSLDFPECCPKIIVSPPDCPDVSPGSSQEFGW